MTYHIVLLINDNGTFYLTDSDDGLVPVDDKTQERLDEIFQMGD